MGGTRKTAQKNRQFSDAKEHGFVATLRALKDRQGWSLQLLHKKTAELDYEQHKGISVGKLHRLEWGRGEPNLRDIRLLARAFGIPAAHLVLEEPFFVIRDATWRGLIDHFTGAKAAGRAHEKLLNEKVYSYASILQEDAKPNDQSGFEYGANNETLIKSGREAAWRRVQQPYVFRVKHTSDEVMREGLAGHEGEEVLYVIEGEMEVWFSQQDQAEPTIRPLSPGDVVQFPSFVPHAFRARKRGGEALALFVYVWRGEPHEAHVLRHGRSRAERSH